MNLDDDTREVLGFGDAWEQLALRWPLYTVARNERVREERRAAGVRPREEYLAAVRHATDDERREAIRRSKREHMRRVRAARAA